MEKIFKIVSFFILFLVTPYFVSAADLSITPASGSFEVGDRVTARIIVSSGTPINAISGIVYFPNSIFSIESVSTSNSILNFWVTEPKFSNESGMLEFEGVALGCFEGGTGTVVTIILRAVNSGTGKIVFNSGQVLANDGQGTNVTSGLNGANFSVTPRKEKTEEPVKKELLDDKKNEEEQKSVAILRSPEIKLAKKFDKQVIVGSTNYPLTEVLVTFDSEYGVKIFITGKTDDQGDFVLLVPRSLKKGNYIVQAVVIQKEVAHSQASNEINIKVGNFFSDIPNQIIVLIFILIFVLAYLIVRSYFYIKNNKKLMFFVKDEAKEAEEIVHKYFKLLNQEIDRADYKKIKKDLEESENLIIKKIKDIERT